MNSRKRTICQHIYCTYVQIMYYGHYEMGNLHILLCMVNWRMREKNVYVFIFSSVQLLSHVRLFVTSWTAARQASLSITNSWSLPKLMSIESVMSSNHLILCCPLLLSLSIFPSIRSFQMSQLLHQVAKVLEFQLQHQSFQRTRRTEVVLKFYC